MHRLAVACLVAMLAVGSSWAGQSNPLIDTLFERLQTADADATVDIEQDIIRLWSQSGSVSTDLLLRRGRAAMAANDLVSAIVDLTTLTALAPDFAEGWNARATAHFLNGDFRRSINDIVEVLRRNPRHFGAINGLALIFEARGDYWSALQAYERLLALSPNRRGAAEAVSRLEDLLARQQL